MASPDGSSPTKLNAFAADADPLRLLRLAVDASPDAIYVKDRDGRYLLINQAGARLVGKRVEEVVGHDDYALFSTETAAKLIADDRLVLESGREQLVEETGTAAGVTRVYMSSKRPLHDAAGRVVGIVGVSRDITERRQIDALLDVEKQVLDLLGRGEPLDTILDFVSRGMERLTPGLSASILLLDADGRHLRHGAAPSLPETYAAAIDGVEIGADVGSCGSAAYLGRRVIVTDIATDPLWTHFRELALSHDLRACWSTPIVSISGAVLGTFAMYYREPRAPTDFELALADAGANVVRLALERRRNEDERTRLLAAESLARAEAELERTRLRQLFEQAPALISIVRGPDLVFELMNRRARAFIDDRDVIGRSAREVFPEIEGQQILEIVDRVYRTGEPFHGKEVPARLDRHGTGTPELGYYNLTYEPVRGLGNRIEGVMSFSFDVTDLVKARQRVEEEHRIAETLNRIGTALAAKLDLQEILQTVTDESTTLTSAQFGAFFYNAINASGESYLLYTLSGAPREAFSKFPAPRATALFGPTFRGEGVVRLDDVRSDPRYGLSAPHHGMPAGHLPVRSYLAVPVVSRSGEVLGGLFFGHAEPARFTERHERLVTGVAAQAAIAVDNARMYDAARAAEAAQARRAEQLQALEERLRLTVEGADVGLWHYDLATESVDWSAGCRRHYGLRPDDPINGEQFLALLRPDFRATVSDLFWKAVEQRQRFDTEYAVITPAGETRWIRCIGRAAYGADGQPRHVDGITLDVTGRRSAEEERAALLRREQAARAEAETALDVRDRFLSAASHELKNPLNALQLHLVGAHRLATAHGSAAAGAIPQRLDKAEQQVARLVRLVDNLLEVSRISAGRLQLEIEPVDIVAVATDIVGQLQVQHPDACRIEVTAPPSLVGRWDRLRLEQIFINLLTNALKYGEGRPVDVIFYQDDDAVTFDVIDRGIGISPDHADRLFQRFERLVGQRQFGGFGLGLWITREIVEALGGQISVASRPHEGSTFSVTLPLDSTPGTQA